ncbi:hypothetical protein PUN28_015538 [Cardiocondyla obscurior]|uniref:Uncharacterized protein n=1 Tax=Cardiocondyla obscurior TaxID=286306 RepID=A0AAW2ETK5_9HYME
MYYRIDLIYISIHSAFIGGISNNAPNSSNVMLLYNLLADNKLCSITARSSILLTAFVFKQCSQHSTSLLSCKKNNVSNNLRNGICLKLTNCLPAEANTVQINAFLRAVMPHFIIYLQLFIFRFSLWNNKKRIRYQNIKKKTCKREKKTKKLYLQK